MAANSENVTAGIETAPREGAPTTINTKPLFKLMVDRKASDLFFTANSPIKIKIEGQIFPINKQILTPETVRQAAYGLMTAEQLEYFNREYEIDFAISEPGLGRFRPSIDPEGRIRMRIVPDASLNRALRNPKAYRGEIRNRANMGLSDADLKRLWDAEHPEDPLVLPLRKAG